MNHIIPRTDLEANGGGKGGMGPLGMWFLSPSYSLISSWRFSHKLRKFGPPGKLLARIWINIFVHARGCFIPSSVVIGRGFSLPHPVGVVIGEGCVIGDSVTIYQNVTLGIAKESQRAYPQIEDGVTIYAGAILLGGIRVGRGSIVAAGAIVTRDVPPHSLAVGAPARVRPLA